MDSIRADNPAALANVELSYLSVSSNVEANYSHLHCDALALCKGAVPPLLITSNTWPAAIILTASSDFRSRSTSECNQGKEWPH